ncbi:Nn.00g089210.m01.CDS01 [Neocucurbitaria sp. VM-36]
MAAPSAVLSELSAHLQEVDNEPTTSLDTDLLEKCELFTSTPEYRSQIWKETRPLFLQIAALLPKLQQDPSALTHFIIKLAEPYRFDDIKDIDFEIGLDLQAVPFHSLILTLLEKATASSSDAQALANRPAVISGIVRLWLCTQDAGIATQAENLLIALLKMSKNEPMAIETESPLHTYGTGPMWRRLFGDRDIISLYYQYTSLKQFKSPPLPLLNKRDKTIAQARLLSWLPRVGTMDWNSVVSSHDLDVVREAGLRKGQGLIHYAALKMVDTEDDMLMHMTLINFFSVLITTVKMKPHLTHYDSSLSLDFVKEEGIHKGIIDFHTSDNPGIEHSFLSSRTSQYISDYASNYPENFENSPELTVVRNYVHRNIRKCEARDLNIIASMPRSTLVPHRSGRLAWDECVILDMPITRTNQDALKTLATVFHGPPKGEIKFPQIETVGSDPKRTQTESVFARLLTALFYTKKPSMFADIVSHIETIAMKDNALAALALVRALITASWSTESLPDTIIPANDQTYTRLNNFPKSGLDVILDPSISGGVLPSLLKPATTFSNLVGGRGDAENAAFQVAMAKFDVLNALGRRLEEHGGRQDVLAMVRRRVSEGPWGVGGSAGSRIGTLEL